eukprot:TRINITY_DN11558_c0_g1_i1.p1 TRINITY_DN11558_c0_g1~~TRINITY_DN11558_c0_g1_i1.p1  ORF type:complete len:688 (-),score=157.08 TRINITY_DN11558_c0_g1_i1:8-2071(-)
MEDKQHFVAELVLKWALDEMRYSPDGKFANAPLPTLTQLKRLCRSNTIPIWEYIISNVKSKRTVDSYRGNVEWLDKMRRGADVAAEREEQRQSLLARRDQLNASITSGRKTAEKINFEIEKLKADLAAAEHAEKTLKTDMMDMDIKKTLLDGFDIRLEDHMALLGEYINRLKSLFARFQARCKESAKEQSLELISNSDGELVSETHAKLTKACEIISKHMQSTLELYQSALEENRPPPTAQELQSNAATFIKQIQGVIATTSPKSLVAMLLQQAKQQTEDLISELNGASNTARQEAEAIRKQLEEEFLSRSSIAIVPISSTDAATKDSIAAPPFPTTEGLLQAQREEHFNTYIATERARNEAHSIRKQTRSLAQQSRSNFDDPENDSGLANGVNDASRERSTIDQLRALEIELATEAAALHCAKQFTEQLLRCKDLYEKDMKQLEEKQRRIAELDAQLQQQQSLVDLLIQQNAAARFALSKSLQTIRKSEIICAQKLDTQIKELCGDLKDSARAEIKLLLDVALADLARNTETGERYADMSINSSSRLTALTSALGMSNGRGASPPPEQLLLAAQKLAWEIDEIQDEIQQRKLKLEASGLSKARLDEIGVLTSQLEKTEQEQLSSWLPVLETQTEQTKKAVEVCESLKETLQDWWEQPAQHLAPWVAVDGKPLQQWLSKWREIRQIK